MSEHGASLDDRVRLAVLVSRARWVSIAFGLVEAFLSVPAPISRLGMVAGLVIAALYNVVAGRAARLPPQWLEPMLVVTLVADFLAITNAVAMAANAPIDNGYLLYVLVAVEAALLFRGHGALGFGVAFVVAFSLWVWERHRLFHATLNSGSYVFGVVTMLIIAGFTAGMASIVVAGADLARRQARRIQEQADENRTHLEATEEANRSLGAFVSMLVHELRSPLTVIAGYSQLLEDPDYLAAPNLRTGALQAISTKAEELRSIVDELLIAARVEAGGPTARLGIVDLISETQAAVDRIRHRAALLQATIALTGPPSPVRVRADPHLLARILDNLLNNALNYGGDHPEISVQVAGDSGGDGEGWVAVADRGVGIADDMRERVFERFFRVRDRTPHPGTGLGLYISRQLAVTQGGSLQLTATEPTCGSTFVLRLPLTVDDADGIEPVE